MLVIVGISAAVIAEFFIASSDNLIATFQTVFHKNYLKLKDYRYNADTGTYEGDGSHRAAYGWTSNNSIFAELGMNYEEIGEQIAMNGEPGLIWLDNIRNFSRMNGAPDYKDWRAVGTNPCVKFCA